MPGRRWTRSRGRESAPCSSARAIARRRPTRARSTNRRRTHGKRPGSDPMTVVAARRYRDGKLIDPALPPHCAPPAKSEFDWVGLVEPTEAEIAEVQERYGLHP